MRKKQMTQKEIKEELIFEIHIGYVNKKYPTRWASYCLDEHPDDLIVDGKVFIYLKPNGICTFKPYCSNIIKNPTYGKILQLCDEIIDHTEDYHHIFLERIEIIKQTDIDTYQLYVSFGS